MEGFHLFRRYLFVARDESIVKCKPALLVEMSWIML
jgi:hypothetical protein